MKKGPARFLGIMIVSSLLLGAQAPTNPPKTLHVRIPIVPARPQDVSTIEAIVTADYESFSGGVGVARDWGRDLSLYDRHARSFGISKNAKTGALEVWTPTLQEYADVANEHFVQAGIVEKETSHKIHRFGNIATVFSAYEGKLTSTGELYSRGVNTYQLYFDGKRWWIASVSWDAERYVSEIPQELLSMK